MSTHCPYCALQCGMRIGGTREAPEISGDPDFDVNRGALCVKGYTSGATLAHPERVTTPLIRNERGVLAPATWDQALDHIAEGVRRVQSRWGRSAVGVFGSGALTNEKSYWLGKFARVALKSPNIDYNGRFCMSSAAAASAKAFGLDRGLPFPLEDIPQAEVVFLAGGNVAETMPPLLAYFEAQLARGGRLVVADPRRTKTAQLATVHLGLAPGTDAALANGLLHILIQEGRIDHRFIEARTEGFERARAVAAGYWPSRVERITGIAEAELHRVAEMLASARSAMILTGRGPEQQSQGVANALAYINLALALGLVGRPGSGYGTLTGQGNGQGGREHGQKADQLPGYRRIDDPKARRHMAEIWGVAEDEIPGPGRSAYELLSTLGEDGGVRALFVFGSNVVVSVPRAELIEARLRALDLLVVTDFFLSETAQLADVVLPAAQWAEEDGTMTNLEGRLLLRRAAFSPPPEVKTDLEIIQALAARLGAGAHFPSAAPEEVFEELTRATRGGVADYSGISHEALRARPKIFWPCPATPAGSSAHPMPPNVPTAPGGATETGPQGTPRLFAETFPTPSGRARFFPVLHAPPAEVPDEEYPLHLTTGRLLAHYQSGTQTRRVARLVAVNPRPAVEVHPRTAQRYGLTHGDAVELVTRRGRAVFVVEVSAEIREDTVFVPFHWGGEGSVNRLTNPALDPTSRMPELKCCAVRLASIEERGGHRS